MAVVIYPGVQVVGWNKKVVFTRTTGFEKAIAVVVGVELGWGRFNSLRERRLQEQRLQQAMLWST